MALIHNQLYVAHRLRSGGREEKRRVRRPEGGLKVELKEVRWLSQGDFKGKLYCLLEVNNGTERETVIEGFVLQGRREGKRFQIASLGLLCNPFGGGEGTVRIEKKRYPWVNLSDAKSPKGTHILVREGRFQIVLPPGSRYRAETLFPLKGKGWEEVRLILKGQLASARVNVPPKGKLISPKKGETSGEKGKR